MLIHEFCHRCGNTQPLVWHADDRLWAKIGEEWSILCPTCFDQMSDELVYWEAKTKSQQCVHSTFKQKKGINKQCTTK